MPEHTPAPTPHRAVYGYAFYLLSYTLFIFYLIWAILPMKEWGFVYLPDKYFAVLLPMLVLVALAFFAFFIYPAINMSLTPNIDELASVASVDVILKNNQKSSLTSWQELRELMKPININDDDCKRDAISCDYCGDSHRAYQSSERIDTLHFIDLADVNKNLYN